MLFGIQQIGTAAVLEDTHVIGPRGGYGTGVHTMLDHGAYIAAAYEFLEKGGKEFVAEQDAAVVESIKAASDVYAPISGTVIEVNSAVAEAPESVNQDAYSAWLFKMKPANAGDLDTLLDAAAYTACAGE